MKFWVRNEQEFHNKIVCLWIVCLFYTPRKENVRAIQACVHESVVQQGKANAMKTNPNRKINKWVLRCARSDSWTRLAFPGRVIHPPLWQPRTTSRSLVGYTYSTPIINSPNVQTNHQHTPLQPWHSATTFLSFSVFYFGVPPPGENRAKLGVFGYHTRLSPVHR